MWKADGGTSEVSKFIKHFQISESVIIIFTLFLYGSEETFV